MATVTYILRKGQPLTEEQKAELDALSKMSDDEIVFDKDCPPQTDEQLKKFRRVNPRPTKAVG